MRIALAQVDTVVGDFAGNVARVRQAAGESARRGARLVVGPELALTGYPPRDFLELPAFVAGADRALEELVSGPLPEGVALLVGTIEAHGGEGAGLYNAAVLIDGGRVVARGRKSLLPTYDVFDEGRYFDPAPETAVALLDGIRLGITICEDLWNDKQFWRRRRYHQDPMVEVAERGAQLVVNLSASPYAVGKPALRQTMIAAAARHHGLPVAMANLVGGNDALVFDGQSFAVDAGGHLLARGPAFEEALTVVDLEPSPGALTHAESEPLLATKTAQTIGEATLIMTPLAEDLSATDLDELLQALVLGTRDYARKTGFHGAVLGLSGGIDSALVAVIAARALGAEQVTTLSMPSRYTAAMSNDDAASLARNLGVHHLVLPIERPFASYLELLREPFQGRASDTAEENLQARVRGALLMAMSNKFGTLLLTTGNKSELATGYCTLYGDMAGGLAVIGDLPKTLVYALVRRVNALSPGLVPERILTRPPSAELKADQTDQDSLPPYEELDRILRRYVEARESAADIARDEPAIDRQTIDRVLLLVRASEYKRRQAAPVLRVTPRAFGEGWRFPIAHRFR